MRKRKSPITDPMRSIGRQPDGTTRSALKSVLTYAVAATIWIFTSDLATAHISTTSETQTLISIIKGIVFILVTSALLYILISNDLSHVRRALFHQRLLARGATGPKVAESPEDAWENIAEAIRDAADAQVAEVWLASDDRTLRPWCSINGGGDRCVLTDQSAEIITADMPAFAWMWAGQDGERPSLARISSPGGFVRDPSLKVLRAVPVPVGDQLGGAILFWTESRRRLPTVYGDAVLHVVGQLTDTLERFQLRADLEHSALYDDLTGLPNRTLLLELLYSSLQDAAAVSEDLLVLKIHIDLMERIEQSLGHEHADSLVSEAAQRLSSALDERDTLARTQTAEFTIVARSAQRTEVADYLMRIREAVSAPVELDAASVPLSVSIGVLVTEGNRDPKEVLSEASTALQRAQDLGRGRTAFFDEGMRMSIEDTLSIEVALRDALTEEQFEVVYQPIVGARSRVVCSAEALVRWNHPTRGQVRPDQFIPVAEDSGIIVEIGHYVLERACAECATWPSIGGSLLGVSVNMSAIEFLDPGLVAVVHNALRKADLDPVRLTIEITETTLMLDPDLAEQTLRKLRDLGVGVALDDFGTGYSSLAYLQRFDIDTLKIDASFVAELPGREDNCALACAIIQMSDALKLSTVAEGVETEEQAAFLDQQGTDYLQGYLISPPLSASAFTELVAAIG